jgi:hypothetical protein
MKMNMKSSISEEFWEQVTLPKLKTNSKNKVAEPSKEDLEKMWLELEKDWDEVSRPYHYSPHCWHWCEPIC